MTWFEILRIRAVRRKFLLNFSLIFLYAAMAGAEIWVALLAGTVGRSAVLTVVIFFALAVILQTVFPPYWIIRPFQGWHVSQRELAPSMWDAARRLSAKLRIVPPELYEFRGIGQGAVGWDFVLSRGVAIELAITRAKGLPGLLESVMAHELAHHKNRDRRMIVLVENLQAMSRVLAVLLAMLASVHMVLGQESVSDLWSAGLAVAVVTFNRFAALPLFMRMLRAHEYAADALGAAATGNRADMAAALIVLDLRAAATIMLLRAAGHDIREPADDEFRSHPDTEDRVRALLGDEDL